MKAGVYIHIPFCRSKCDYCGFYSTQPDNQLINRFITRLEQEFRENTCLADGVLFDSVFFGGGTPSMLGLKQIERIMMSLKSMYTIDPRAEITIEINPSDVSRELLDGLRDLGFNRLTLGVQTLDTAAYHAVGRKGGYCSDDILEKFFSTKRVSLCADIIAGIPGESAEAAAAAVQKIIGFGAAHISLYLLTLEHGSPYALHKKNFSEIEECHAWTMFDVLRKMIIEHGFSHYEISNFALPGYESRHNLLYWQWGSWLGFGPSAHSFFGNKRFFNTADLSGYLEASIREFDERSAAQEYAEFFMTGLRLMSGISETDFRSIFGTVFPASVVADIEDLVKSGDLLMDTYRKSCRISDGSLRFADSIIFNTVKSLL